MNRSTASREILWNMSGIGTYIGMYGAMILALIVLYVGVHRRVDVLRLGASAPSHWGEWGRRINDVIQGAFLQKGTVRRRSAALFHTLIYVGFLVLLFTTTMVFIDHDLGIKIYHGEFYLLLTIASDVLGLGFLFGLGLAAHRRYILHRSFLHSRTADSFVLWILALMIVQGFVLEGLRIHVTNDPWRLYSPVGLLFAKFFWSLSDSSARLFHSGVWVFHTATVFVAIALVPYTKLFHIISSSANIFFRRGRGPLGKLESLGDMDAILEKGEEVTLGLRSIKNYSWKHLMDLEACTSCGRCQEVCPAHITGKPLSPKWIILDTRNHVRALQAEGRFANKSLVPQPFKALDSFLSKNLLLGSSGVVDEEGTYRAQGEYRSLNVGVQRSVQGIGGSSDDTISGEVIDPLSFWSCTTCLACVEACPVGINQLDQIIGNRRAMTLMEGSLPSEAQSTLRSLETKKNPFGPPSDRIKWAHGLEVPIVGEGDSVEYLYWVGCVSAYDQRKQNIARSLVKLMQHAKLSFGVLGNAEGCSGDPARRLGEENVYQSLAKYNIEVLKSVKFKYLVANCPHCFNTIKNEYPEFGNLGEGKSPEILHHSVLLKRLLAEGTLAPQKGKKEFTFHDPCYLGRFNNEYDAPRDVVTAISRSSLREMKMSRNKGMCCGAGGGHYWMDLKIGDRINARRADQAAETGAEAVATACPFCLHMMEDGMKLTGREEQMEVRDIAEVLADALSLS
jgi:Fe-S oxidoreductase/nitrate reductase gamma subunit